MRYARRRRSGGGFGIILLIIVALFIYLPFFLKKNWIPVLIVLACVVPLYLWERKQERKRIEIYRQQLKEKYGTPSASIALMIELINKLLLFEKQLTAEEKREKRGLMQKFTHLMDENGIGYVYFVKAHGTDGIKIGKADDPLKRIVKGFGVKIHVQLELLYLIRTNNPYATEHQFHEYFQSKRLNGEWFNLNDDDMKWVRSAEYSLSIYQTIK